MIAVMAAVATLIAEGIVNRSTPSPRHCPATASCRVHRRRGFIHSSLQKSETHFEVRLAPPSFPVSPLLFCPEGRHKSEKKAESHQPGLFPPTNHSVCHPDKLPAGYEKVYCSDPVLPMPARTRLQREREKKKKKDVWTEEKSKKTSCASVSSRRHSVHLAKIRFCDKDVPTECLTKSPKRREKKKGLLSPVPRFSES